MSSKPSKPSEAVSILSPTPIDVQSFDVVSNRHDLRRDLHRYVQYVDGRNIKRSYRTNELPAADIKRLGQLLNIDPAEEAAAAFRYGAEASTWIDYVDGLALMMGFVSYDTKGSYRGYSSSEPSFPDNFVVFNREAYRKFLALPLAEQERKLFDTLVRGYSSSYNEFYQYSILGRLDRFPMWGSAVGVMPTLNFAGIRRFLFDLLQSCEAGVWYSTASLIAFLKAQHPYFLIPADPKIPRSGRFEGRYGNFFEDQYAKEPIPNHVKDGFERVEGRYVERFLEGIPLTLGYVEVAYQETPRAFPMKGRLAAFRLHERFLQAMRGDIPQPRVVVQPNFEIFVESAFYPAYVVERLSHLAEVVKEDTATLVLKLQKQKVAAQAAANDAFDVIDLLKTLTGSHVPQNVAIELQEWVGQADVFTLYAGVGLLESADPISGIKPYIIEQISERLSLIRQPQKARAQLQSSGKVVMYVRHADDGLKPLPLKAHTLFPKSVPAKTPKAKPPKQPVAVKREILVALYFPSDDLFEKFRKGLLDAHCAVEANKEKRMLTVAGRDEAHIKQVIKDLSDEYAIRLEDSP